MRYRWGTVEMHMPVEGMSALVQRSGELLILTLCGVLTLRGVAIARLRLLGLLADQDARAVVIDMRGVIPLFGRNGWRELAAPGPVDGIDPPVALVMVPRYERQMRAYCLEMALRGKVRGPFIGLHGAVEWASRRREHWHHLPPGSQTPQPAQTGHEPAPDVLSVDRPSLARS
jgi:hypothetical protein